MSVGEIVGLCLSVALLAGAVGACAGVILARGRTEARVSGRERRVAVARWIAARKSMSRAASSFVTSFRALALEAPDSANRSLREQEAQRCRAAWCAACSELEQVEAELNVLHGLELSSFSASTNVATDVTALRTAIDGDAASVKAFMVGLGELNRSAMRQAGEWTTCTERRPASLQRWFSSLACAIDAFTARLGRRN